MKVNDVVSSYDKWGYFGPVPWKMKAYVFLKGAAGAFSNSVEAFIRGQFLKPARFLGVHVGYTFYKVNNRLDLNFKCDSNTGKITKGPQRNGETTKEQDGPLKTKIIMEHKIEAIGENKNTVTVDVIVIAKVGGKITSTDIAGVGNGDYGGASSESSISHDAGSTWRIDRTFILTCSCKK
ncbi:hypothetical protein AAEX28_15690 [Lentisphaerota bacterium WC36G]|nr:hypothetical protein LJT99_02455 [Lentisphaerae bacterium WC36]